MEMERKGRKMALNYAAYCSELSMRFYLFIYLFIYFPMGF